MEDEMGIKKINIKRMMRELREEKMIVLKKNEVRLMKRKELMKV